MAASRSLFAFCREASAPWSGWDRLYWEADGSIRLGTLTEDMTGRDHPGVAPALRSPPAIAKLLADWRSGRVEMIADGGPDLGYAVDLVVPRGLARGAGVLVADSEAEAYLCGWPPSQGGPRYLRPWPRPIAEEPAGARRGPAPYDDAALLDRVAHHYRTMTPKRSINGAVTLTIKELGKITPPIATSEAAVRSRLRGKFKDQIIAGVAGVQTPANNGN
jgi:hypothetical protein